MCGIAGYWNTEQRELRPLLEKMSDLMRHRGPDAAGIYIDDISAIGLIHRRLSIIDLSEEANQPFHSACNRYVIVFNGEVYNYKQLHQTYIPYFKPRTYSDTEIVLQLFIEMGDDFVQYLNGMFAFAIYDKQTQKGWLYRDRLGVKPLFYIARNGFFAFASELKSLTVLPICLTPNRQALAQFLHLGYIPQPHTAWEEIHKFPAGHKLVFSPSSYILEPWWEMHRKFTHEPIRSESVALKQLDDLVQDAVSIRLISDVPYGTFLSGGIDSSLVTAVASKFSPGIRTFSIRFEDARHDESKHSQAVAAKLQTSHTEFTVTENEAIPLVEKLLSIYDEPFADSSFIPTYMVSELASSKVKMTLTGDGGDEQFMGYGAYVWARRMAHPAFFYSRNLIAKALSYGNNREKRAGLIFRAPDNKADLHSHIFSQEQYLFSAAEIQQLLPNPFPSLTPPVIWPLRSLSPAERQAFFDLEYYLRDDLLVKVDRASMYHGIEAREPLLDYRIIEWSINLHESLKLRNGTSKYLLKKLLYQYLPAEMFDRPKRGFSVPMDRWLNGPLSYLIDVYLSPKKIQECNWLNSSIVSAYVKRFLQGETYLYNRIWAMIVLQKFLTEQSSLICFNTDK